MTARPHHAAAAGKRAERLAAVPRRPGTRRGRSTRRRPTIAPRLGPPPRVRVPRRGPGRRRRRGTATAGGGHTDAEATGRALAVRRAAPPRRPSARRAFYARLVTAVRDALALARLAAGRRHARAPPALAGDTDAGRRHRRRRLHRAVDRALPARAGPDVCASSSLEAEVAGFGASGRNGGWCSALLPDVALTTMARAPGRTMRSPCSGRCSPRSTRSAGPPRPRASTATSPRAATSTWPPTPPTPCDSRAELTEARRFGLGEEDLRLARSRRGRRAGSMPPACSVRCTPRTAPRSTRPASLAAWPRPSSVGGGDVHEGTRAKSIEPGRVRHRPRHRAGRDRRAGHRGLHGRASTASSGRSCRSTR